MSNPRAILPVLALLAAFAPLSIDMYLPALPAIAADLRGSMEGAQLTLAAFFLGMAAGQLVHGPLADRYGRRRPLFAGLVIYTLASLGCALAWDMGWLVALRLLQALGGCAGLVISRAVVRDLSDQMDPVRMMARLFLIMGVAPIVAPLLGGWVAAWLGWRAIFGFLALVGVAALALTWRFLPETLPPAARRRVPVAQIARDFGGLLVTAPFMAASLGSGFAIAGMFAYIAGSPFVFMRLYGVAPENFGWLFGAGAAGVIAFGQMAGPLAQRFGRARVYGLALLALGVAALVAVGVTALGLGFWALYAALLGYLCLMGLALPLGAILAITPFPHMAGTASALIGTLQFALGAVAGLALALLHDGTALPLVAVMAGASLCGLSAWWGLGASLRRG